MYILGRKLSPYISDGTTFYKNIYSVKPGENLIYDLDTFQIKHHSQINLELPDYNFLHKNKIEIISQFEKELTNSIDIRFDADANVGMSISGGVDSLTIFSLINKKKLSDISFYTIFDDVNNEDYRFIKKLKNEKNFKLTEVPFTYDQNLFENYLNILSNKMEIPVNFHATAIPTLLISEKMKEDKIKVCIDGIGGDEIIGGYPIYHQLSMENLRKNKVFESITNFIRYYNFQKPKFSSGLYAFLSILHYGLINRSKLNSQQKYNESIIKITSNLEIKNKLINLNNKLNSEKVLNLKEHQLFELKFNLIPFMLEFLTQ